jgi:hypothetical protein
VVDDNPPGNDPWVRERHQRACILRGLNGCQPTDAVLVSDLDEIPNPSGVSVFEHRNCYYFLNTSNGYWYGSRMAPYSTLLQLTPNGQRFADGHVVGRSGWHYSFLGGPAMIAGKIRAFAHQEYNSAWLADPDRVAAILDTGADLFGRTTNLSRMMSPDQLPAPVREHPERYAT